MPKEPSSHPTFAPVMTPAPGERGVRFVGDRVRFSLRDAHGGAPPEGWRARLRTNLGRAEILRREIIHAHAQGLPVAGASWRDLPMQRDTDGWWLEIPLAETGYFKAKAYALDTRGWQHWPAGADFGLAVHPDAARTANTIYCAFTRMFGSTKSRASTSNAKLDKELRTLDQLDYTVIPPSGKLRDLIPLLPHIVDTLGCRILHLLPVNPTPTTFARFGRFGSPYASLDLTGIDPALVVFDKRTTGVDQFCELAYATHRRGARLFLDIVINHTGWASALQEQHPEWFARRPDGEFESPGVWGTIWEDLVELKHDNVALWDELADVFLTWCRRGVDGFRCDAGYMVPMPAWQYITARVQQRFPETIFLLEGLGGAWEATESLLADGGMQWAYSELFQNHTGLQVSGYLDHALQQSSRSGLLVNYSETHDNDRLAAQGRAWSLLRNRLCALASVSGGFGFTSGVEWLAPEKINVHSCRGLAWGAMENLVPELAALNRLLAGHPCFFDGAKLTRLSADGAPVFALHRESGEGKDTVLVLVNLDTEQEQPLELVSGVFWSGPGAATSKDSAALSRSPLLLDRRGAGLEAFTHDLLGQRLPIIAVTAKGEKVLKLAPGAAFCLAPAVKPVGLGGDDYRRARAQAAWAVQALCQVLPPERLDGFDWRALAGAVETSPQDFLVAASHGSWPGTGAYPDRPAPCHPSAFPNVIVWSLADRLRVTPVPPSHWLLVEDGVPFRAVLSEPHAEWPHHVQSIAAAGRHVACFPPRASAAEATLTLERYADTDPQVSAELLFLAPEAGHWQSPIGHWQSSLVLLTNGRGGMARLCADLGRVTSKYDCVLGANLHPNLPVDRHVFAKRLRAWVNADGFISPLDALNLSSFQPGPPAVWRFTANAGDARTVEIQLAADMLPARNTTIFCFARPSVENATGKQLPADADVRLTVRLDIEDRNFHCETKRNGGAEHHFAVNTHPLAEPPGFAFTPAPDRELRVFAVTQPDGAAATALQRALAFHAQPEWSEHVPHPVEQSRGQTASGDAFSPGWFELPLPKGASVGLVVTAEATLPDEAEINSFKARVRRWSGLCRPVESGDPPTGLRPCEMPPSETVRVSMNPVGALADDPSFTAQLLRSAQAFVVRRGTGKTVIAGYPWFLDWGRDTLICARGLLAAGLVQEVREILVNFGRFEERGTLPNTIHGDHVSNRDTSDAPLWFGVACEDLAALGDPASEVRSAKEEQNPKIEPAAEGNASSKLRIYSTPVDSSGRAVADVLRSIAANYVAGTPNGIRMDSASALIWSPGHFTWMDTNYPAGTPREGYPIEIQVLWIRLLRQLHRLGAPVTGESWAALADRAQASLGKLFWLGAQGWFADVLTAQAGVPAAQARPEDALRSNCLFAISLGLIGGERARSTVEAARRHLVVPGALRSLAPLPVQVPLPILAADGRLLNDPAHPYWGRYEGDEDTRRKPAYHNGTAWTWTLPVFCEALARAYEFSPEAVAAARAYLGSMERLMAGGCLGQIPEIVDGNAPHTPRGCDAQAWGVTEALRVWKLLSPAE